MKLTKDEKNKMIYEIQYFFENEREESIGIIAAEEVLDFFLESIGKIIYNKGLDDAKIYFEKRLEDLALDYELLKK
ncbi:uncharacterized protein (DUF2164 family) [Hypnocyclicus thermotrophus]|uniref:Uncharacterized protein (DUF2164 family) n=1 Tax=Hypnocyclicus thermotrophus TaxID=1627895 RepID=A0AA46DX26_9FUSO|nr:DUF2164 domain-containing protein [Hypnocyclicus thermotrophus]TDT67418.1 uncharacterized protein (DUF2164 family) [Hypnocyclicus thermotrophus]